ncbi:MAG: hypothetical protein EBY26_04820 [Microbacteriaceae bacterium]|nr:hypothetical protein [Microbacteriaceae bacterium]
MNDWLGPSAFTPKPSEEEYSRAPKFDGPVGKFFKWFGIAVAAMLGFVLWVMGSFISDTIKYGPNGKKKR